MTQSHGEVIAIVVVFVVLQTSAVILRWRARSLKSFSLGIDDYCIFVASLTFTLFVGVPTIIQAIDVHLGDHVEMHHGMPEIPTYAFRVCERIMETCHTIPLSFAKLSLLFFYRRIFRGNKFLVINWITIALAIMWGIGLFFALLFLCTPVSLYVQQSSSDPSVHCVNQEQLYDSLSVSDFIIDMIILLIPIPFVWKLQMPTRHKIAVSSIFLLGLLTIAVSLTRLVFFVRAAHLYPEQQMDWTYYSAPTTIWTNVECGLAITAACLPTLRPCFHGWSPESVVNSFRSAISLHSIRSKGSLNSLSNSRKPKSSGQGAGFELKSSRPSESSSTQLRNETSIEGLGDSSKNNTTSCYTKGDETPPLSTEAIVIQKEWGSFNNV